uniref:RING-CH-type domain-containing protein n=1 Tax=Ascaris lumbricoides TaxID=6252 RepID=A0A9J2PBF1_ASCLU
MHESDESGDSPHSSHLQMDSTQTTKLLPSKDDEKNSERSDNKGEEEKPVSNDHTESSARHKYFQRGISVSDNAISSHQLSSSFIVSKLSGVLSTLLEIGERRPSSRGSAVLVARSRIPYVPAAFETPVIRRVQSVRASSSTKGNALHGDAKDCEGGGTNGGLGDEPECSCGACSKWKPRVPLSSEENTMAEKCDPEWVQCGYYSDVGALCEACAGRPLLDGTCCRHNEQASTLGSFDTLCSFTANCSNMSRDTNSEHLCRICHCSSMPDDPLISPCRCSGTLKYVHMTCLLASFFAEIFNFY